LTALAFGYMLAATWVFAVSAPAGSIDRYWGDARAHQWPVYRAAAATLALLERAADGN
jgi:hypothetical protein